MKSGRCPKCGSSDVRSGASVKYKMGSHGANSIPLGTFWLGYAPLDNYVCVSCRYVESYVAEKKHLEKIKEKWPGVFER